MRWVTQPSLSYAFSVNPASGVSPTRRRSCRRVPDSPSAPETSDCGHCGPRAASRPFADSQRTPPTSRPVYTNNRTIPLNFRDEYVAVGAHIACFWERPGEFRDAVRFLQVGLERGEVCVIFGHTEGNRRVCESLAERGYDCAYLVSFLKINGNLRVRVAVFAQRRPAVPPAKRARNASDSGWEQQP